MLAVLLCHFNSVYQVFEDHVTSCDILLKLAELHLKQKLYSRAVELVLEAQVHEGRGGEGREGRGGEGGEGRGGEGSE